MRLTFPYTVSLLSDDQYRLSFRGYDVAVVEPTVGEALDAAQALLLEKIDERLKEGRSDIEPRALPGDSLFFFSVLLSVLLRRRCLEAGITTAELSRRMGLRPIEASRILDLTHATKIDTMERALYAVGLELDFSVRPREDWDETPYR